jgi:hypothetical protein
MQVFVQVLYRPIKEKSKHIQKNCALISKHPIAQKTASSIQNRIPENR